MPRIIDTTSGKVRGFERDGCEIHLGIPYAEPPFGAGLFQPPRPRAPWQGVRDCTAYGPIVPQPPMPVMPWPAEPGEDCLSVNVWSPAGASGLPVMVWFHGGAYMYGSGAESLYDGGAFARDGVVLVTLNYRLGALGFLHAGSLDPAYSEATGNYGLADQIAALRWVRDNIAAFGGDPGNVTVFGESAGGTYVLSLLGCPSAAGLFTRAISQSAGGPPLYGFPPEAAEPVARLVLDELGVTPAELPALPYQRILDAQVAVLGRTDDEYLDVVGPHTIPFLPLTGAGLLPLAPIDAVAAGAGAGVDLIAGTNRDELATFELMGTGGPAFDADRMWPDDPARHARITAVYEATHEAGSPTSVSVAVGTDRAFRVPSVRMAEAHARAGGATRMYLFGWRSPAFDGRLGAGHAMEIPFVFGDLASPMLAMLLGERPPRRLADAMHGSWIAFATGGDPAAGGHVPEWPPYEPERRATMVFDDTCEVVLDLDAERLAAWNTP
ncbi:carboxylesterase/lipase family protein [Nonomuraea cavernae]|uniref:carboxylesterase/lipase family protein n=1 Tax=Nonomuraea cavernae TaxID=2045107 RepID=UPI0033FE13D2